MTVTDITAADPFASASSDFFRNPYPFYEQIRRRGNLVWSEAGEKRWIVVGYDAAVKILNDPRFSVKVPESQFAEAGDISHITGYQDLVTGFTKFMLAQDPPEHTRVRKLANKAFTRARVAELSGTVDEIINGLLNPMIERGNMDFIAEFAFPLPITLICGILGLPSSDHQRFRQWSERVIRTDDLVVDQADLEAGAQAAAELFDYLRALIARRRKEPGNDLLSAFVQAEEEGDTLSLDELLANMMLLIIAGHETTVNMLASGMLCMLKNPEAMSKLRQNPDFIPSAVEEILRFESPLQITIRYVLEDLQLEGHHLRREDKVCLIIGAINRDPQQFESPDVFNIERQPNKHLAFGQGIHFCLGAPLARFEGKSAFEKLLSRLHNIELAVDEVEYKPSTSFRALRSLPISFETR